MNKSMSIVMLLPFFSSIALAGNIYVSLNNIHSIPNSDLGWGTYTDDSGDHDAYTNLQQAVNAAVSGDTVWVENGFVCDAKDGYSPATGKWCNSRLRIKSGVTVRSRSGHWTSGCVIEGSAVEPKVGGVHFSQNDHSGKIIGFEIRNCERNNSSGGKAVYYGTISNCFVHTCLESGSTLENTWVYDSVISNCWASSQGIAYNGALYNCEIVDIGKDKTTQSVDGGQLVMQGRGTVSVGIVSNCTFRNCYGRPWLVTSKQVYSVEAAPLLMNCRFIGCRGGAVVGTEYGSSLCINLTNCVFTANTAPCVSFSYVAVTRTGDFATCWNCFFTNNMSSCVNGAGNYYNCLFANNASAGGFIHNQDVTKPLSLYNCTVLGNTGTGNYGTADGNTRAVNTILRGNTIKSGYVDSLLAATNCCLEDAASVVEEQDNIRTDAALIDPANGIYSPGELSPCFETGSVTAYALTPTDLAGRPRTTGGKVSIGAYEYDPSKHHLSGSVTYPTYLYTPAKVTLAASVAGFGTSPQFYWDFDGDGRADEITSVPTLTHDFGIGTWPVKLSVSNLTEQVGQTMTYAPFAVTKRPVRYVKDGNENAAEPYDTEANAAATIQTAIDYCSNGDEVVILPATYNVLAPVTVNKDLIVHGSTGNPEDVVIRETAKDRCLVINGGAETIVHSLVLEKGGKDEQNCQGAGVAIAANAEGTSAGCGILSNAVVRNCRVSSSCAGTPGVAAIGPSAFVTHCVISNNCSYSGYQNSGRLCALALYLTGGARAENCLVTRNYTDTVNPYGLTYDLDIWNESGDLGYAWQGYHQVSVHVGDGSSLRFSTIVTNRASFCGGVNVNGTGSFSDCVIAGNVCWLKYVREKTPRYAVWSAFVDEQKDWHYEAKSGVGKAAFDAMLANEVSAAATLGAGQTTNAVTVADIGLGAGTIVAPTEKLVRNISCGRFGLPPGSPAIDVVPKTVVTGMASGDLLGNPRLNGPAYDLGAFEKIQRGMTILVR